MGLAIYVGIGVVFVLFTIYLMFTSHQRVCNEIYSQKPLYRHHKVIRNFLTPDQCVKIIHEAETYAEHHGWSTRRHEEYPTTDNEITKSWPCYPLLMKQIKQQLLPHFVALFQLKPNTLKVEEIFVAKYEGDRYKAQKDLKEHEDGSEFSFILALNDNYEGGGTRFIKKGETVKLNTGDILIFSGQTRHAGVPVTKGTRYIVPGFIYYGTCTQQDE